MEEIILRVPSKSSERDLGSVKRATPNLSLSDFFEKAWQN
ncbi:hypothetical protein A33Q_4098 [Indibacter alkaliphilus LW1]|uniref:Uncharacterized protein n=1 Tax=Indibacter alkaliphilus (strain CCUG 57479 / KCTC 22604 / LW1) TaxID=1189612 RepID=S2D4N1_INDAL|nr:hypothetical protein A33Q_4098 [Indibacter alkaliphilus LW1]